MSQSYNKRHYKKKRKKSANSPQEITKKTRTVNCDSDAEYQSAAEQCLSDTFHTERKMAAKLSVIDLQNIAERFTLRDDDIDRIVNKLRQSIIADIKKEIITEHVAPLASALAETKKSLSEQIDENVKLKSELNELKLAIDEQEQYSRRSCLRINGVSGDEGDFNEDVETKLLNLAQTHNINITPNDIDVAHRLGKHRLATNRSVIVKFTNMKARQRVLTARKQLGNVYVNEDLTRFRQSLHYHARQLVRSKKIIRTWIAGGKVFCCIPSPGSMEGIRFHIRSMTDIDNLQNGQ